MLIGGHGTDELHGGKGNDWMRGDTGNDSFDGGDDTDVVSFMTAMPPVEGDPTHTTLAQGTDGVVVDFTDPCVNPNQTDNTHHDGCAYGDGQFEPIDNVESSSVRPTRITSAPAGTRSSSAARATTNSTCRTPAKSSTARATA